MAILTEEQLNEVAAQGDKLESLLQDFHQFVGAGQKDVGDYLNITHEMQDKLNHLVTELEDINDV